MNYTVIINKPKCDETYSYPAESLEHARAKLCAVILGFAITQGGYYHHDMANFVKHVMLYLETGAGWDDISEYLQGNDLLTILGIDDCDIVNIDKLDGD